MKRSRCFACNKSTSYIFIYSFSVASELKWDSFKIKVALGYGEKNKSGEMFWCWDANTDRAAFQ